MQIYFRKLNICPMRKVNTHQYERALRDAGHHIVATPEEADTILVWTCAFREDFHENSFAVLKQLETLGKRVVAAGCLPSISPERIQREFQGDIIHFKNDQEEFRTIFGVDIEAADYPICERPLDIPIEEMRKRHPDTKIAWDDQYVKLFIAEGCTRKCSYCTEIRAFGPFASYPLDKLVSKAAEVCARTNNYSIALFGDDIGAWGTDINAEFPDLLEALMAIHPKVRISCKQINPFYMMRYLPKLAPYMQQGKIFQVLVPIQSANQRILDAMGRGYTVKDLHTLFRMMDDTNVEIETHVIAGFPTETKQEWQETVDFICTYNVRYVMGNVFMAGEGTKAALMPGQIPTEEKERRMLEGTKQMEQHGTVVGHSLNFSGKSHIALKKLDLIEF